MLATKANLFNTTYKGSSQALKGEDKGFINNKAQTSITTKKSGTTTLNSGIYAQYKVDKNSGVASEISLQSTTTTVQKELNTSDLIINRHKLNTQLFEFTNMKANMDTVMGNLGMSATVLVKVWEPNLEQYVLIRRPARFPVFGNLLDAYIVDPRLGINDTMATTLFEYKTQINEAIDTEEEGETV